jgi:hypothetical protein
LKCFTTFARYALSRPMPIFCSTRSSTCPAGPTKGVRPRLLDRLPVRR